MELNFVFCERVLYIGTAPLSKRRKMPNKAKTLGFCFVLILYYKNDVNVFYGKINTS